MFVRIASGLKAPFVGLAFLAARPPLLGLAAVPIGLMVVGIGLVSWFVLWWTPSAVAAIAPPPDGLLGSLWWGLTGALMLLLLGAGAIVAWAASTLFATPFYDALCGRIEAEVTGTEPPDVPVQQMLADAGVSVLHTLLASAILLVASLALALLALIPVVDVLVPFLEIGLTVVFVARELLDFPLSRQRLGFGAKLARLWAQAPELLALGAMSALLLCVPVLNLIVMPGAVAGCTLLVLSYNGSDDHRRDHR